MTMSAPQFEDSDLAGLTVHLNGTVGTTAIQLASNAKVISEFWVMNPYTNPRANVLFVSLDGGVNYRTLPWNSEFSWSLKGGVKSVYIKGSVAGTLYESIINIEVD